MKKKLFFLFLGATLCFVFLLQIVPQAFTFNSNDASEVKKGEYLVTISGCDDCHTPKVFTKEGPHPDFSRRLSGHPADEKLPKIDMSVIGPSKWGALMNNGLTAFVGPWGVSFAQNLTSDKQTGLGLWTEDIFIQTMRTGKHMGKGRPILPPMPWFNLAKASDEDLKAIFSYLQSLPPIKNKVPQPIPPQGLVE